MTGLEIFRDISHNKTMQNTYRFSTLLFSIMVVFMYSHSLYAFKITVKKVKGNNAIVETDTPLEEGQTYDLANDPVSSNVDYGSNAVKIRKNSLSFGANFESVRSDLSQSTQFNLQVRYGWNFSSLEFGAMVAASGVDVGAGSTNSLLAGGYFDYNLVNNREPNNMIYGPFVLLATGSTQYPSSSTGGSSTKIESNAGGFLTYFLGTSNTAIRGEAFYDYQQINTTAQQNTVGGFGARGLLVLYF